MLTPLLVPLVAVFAPSRPLSPSFGQSLEPRRCDPNEIGEAAQRLATNRPIAAIDVAHRLRGGFAAAAATSSCTPLGYAATPLRTSTPALARLAAPAGAPTRIARVPRARSRSATPLLSLRGGVFSKASAALTPLGAALARLPAGLVLAVTIVLEVAATTCMKKASTGGSIWYLGVFLGYTSCFSLFPIALRSISLSVAYATWSGAGTAASVAIGVLLFKERLTTLKMFCVGLIIAGVIGINL